MKYFLLAGCGCMVIIFPSKPNKQDTAMKSHPSKTIALRTTEQSTRASALSWTVRVNQGHTGSTVKCSCSSLTAHAALRIVLSTCRGLGNVWPMLEGENARLTSESSGWCSVPWALQHRRCQTLGPSLLLSEPTDQTLGTGLSKPILSWGEEQTERLCCSLLVRKRDKKSSLLWLEVPVFSTELFLVSCLCRNMFMNVPYLLTIWGTLSASGGLLQNNIFHVPACLQQLEECVLCSYVFLKSKRKDVEMWRQSMKTWYSVTRKNKQ